MQERLNKYIASSGVCSRRKADELIQDGRIKVNGEVVKDLGADSLDVVEMLMGLEEEFNTYHSFSRGGEGGNKSRGRNC